MKLLFSITFCPNNLLKNITIFNLLIDQNYICSTLPPQATPFENGVKNTFIIVNKRYVTYHRANAGQTLKATTVDICSLFNKTNIKELKLCSNITINIICFRSISYAL